MKKPIIGITTGINYDDNKYYLYTSYVNGIIKGGGMPIVIPPVINSKDIDKYIEFCDGFVFPGGNDVDASKYGENNIEYKGYLSPERDDFEIKMINRAVEHKKPIVGICRGMQIINVALGGSLHQDISSALGKAALKHNQEAPIWHPTHKVKIAKESILYKIFNVEELDVNSYHHQAVKTLGKDLISSGVAADGAIEAIEKPNPQKNGLIFGVQWHPEMMWDRDEKFLNIIKYLTSFILNKEG